MSPLRPITFLVVFLSMLAHIAPANLRIASPAPVFGSLAYATDNVQHSRVHEPSRLLASLSQRVVSYLSNLASTFASGISTIGFAFATRPHEYGLTSHMRIHPNEQYLAIGGTTPRDLVAGSFTDSIRKALHHLATGFTASPSLSTSLG